MAKKGRSIAQRIRAGEVRRRDVNRRLAELAFGKANDCVRLALEEQPDLDRLDLTLLSEIRCNDKGAVEIKLVDRLKVLEQLARVMEQEDGQMDAFLQALQGGENG